MSLPFGAPICIFASEPNEICGSQFSVCARCYVLGKMAVNDENPWPYLLSMFEFTLRAGSSLEPVSRSPCALLKLELSEFS